MSTILEEYISFCQEKKIMFESNESILSYDNSTLFCTAGMQKYRAFFNDPTQTSLKTLAGVQDCLRLTDLDTVGDGSHLLHFKMLGLFSFDSMTIAEAINFWHEFLQSLNIKLSMITIHPNKFDEWKDYHGKHHQDIIQKDSECIWSDGNGISGYCTEFYADGIEIGNIVNPKGNCIDCGFGMERLRRVLLSELKTTQQNILLDKQYVLRQTVKRIAEEGVEPSNKGPGYILRKLLRQLIKEFNSADINLPFMKDELDRQTKLKLRYAKLLPKNLDKSAAWWFDTHGIDLTELLD